MALNFSMDFEYRYTEPYRQFVMNNINYLENNLGRRDIRTVTDEEAASYKGDFKGLLARLGVPSSMHWVVSVMNRIHSNSDFDGEGLVLRIPNSTLLSRLDTQFKDTGV